MKNLPHIELSEICYQLGEGSPKSIKQVFGGDIHESWQIEFNNAKSVSYTHLTLPTKA